MPYPPPKVLLIFSDAQVVGGNVGVAGVGAAVLDDGGNLLARGGSLLGKMTCNQAELLGIRYGMQLALRRFPWARTCHVVSYTDSMVARLYMTTERRTNLQLATMADETKEVARLFAGHRVGQVPRDNKGIRASETACRRVLRRAGFRLQHRAKKGGRRHSQKSVPEWNPFRPGENPLRTTGKKRPGAGTQSSAQTPRPAGVSR